jgi:hypothetical protein
MEPISLVPIIVSIHSSLKDDFLLNIKGILKGRGPTSRTASELVWDHWPHLLEE